MKNLRIIFPLIACIHSYEYYFSCQKDLNYQEQASWSSQ